MVDHERRRREIAEAAWRAVARGGLEAATVREIASEAGYSTGVLAHYFEDKDALLVHTLHVSVERAVGRFERGIRGKVGIEALRAVLLEALPLDEERAEEMRVWLEFWARAARDEALRAEQNYWYSLWRGVVRALVEESQRRGDLGSTLDPVREANSLVALVDGVGMQAVFEPGKWPPEEQRALLDAHLERLRGAAR
ncbi:TetR/AcrR family transcriptional regulator [Rubrobacter naiadicus]|uniref:TetR/AcrR family transcriptional regulator n=1 Tax=Rubrobacter naiadicus TaxID=1392641 RepID=UPI002360832D|nr:TetR/AcrR family transcriptional regulator [Rubrobacter naiadicus]